MNVCSALGTMSSSKSLSAAMSRSASRSVWSGRTMTKPSEAGLGLIFMR